MAQPTIFLLEEDNDTRPVFKQVLQDRNFNVLLAVDEKDALQRTTGGLTKMDFILVNLIGKTIDEMLKFGKHLRENAKQSVPVLIIATDYTDELAGTIARTGDSEYVIYLDTGAELLNLLSELLKS